MAKLKDVKKLVKFILENDEKARNSDNYLYFMVINLLADKNSIDISAINIASFLLNAKAYPFPPFESVRRARQKVQEEFPHLAARETVQGFRAENETAYREFARG